MKGILLTTLLLLSGSIVGILVLNGSRTSASLSKHPSLPRANDLLNQGLERKGQLALAEGKIDDALAAFSELVRRNPRDPFLHRNLAKAYDAKGLEREAFSEWTIVMKGLPGGFSSDQDDPVILAHYGDLSAKFKDNMQAVESYKRAVEKAHPYMGQNLIPDPSSHMSLATWKSAAHYVSGLARSFRNEPSLALEEMMEAVRDNPESGLAHFGLGWTLVTAGDRRGAVREFQLSRTLVGASQRTAMDRVIGPISREKVKTIVTSEPDGKVRIQTVPDGTTPGSEISTSKTR